MVNIRICPKCMKPKLKPATNVSGWLAPDMYECTNCGYIGYFFVEIDSENYELDEKDDLEDSRKEL